MHLMENDCVGLLTPDGAIHLYDMQSYATYAMPFDRPVEHLCKGAQPDQLWVGLEQGESNAIYHVNLNKTGAMKSELGESQKIRSIACDPLGRYLAVVSGGTGMVYQVKSGEKVLQFSSQWKWDDGPSSWIRFDETGKYFCYGGDWAADMRIYATGSWSNILSVTFPKTKEPDSHFTDVVMDRVENGRSTLLLIKGSPKKFESLSIDPDRFSISTNWTAHTGSSPMAIIPFTDPETGKRNYWCKLWFQDFQLYDAKTGEASVFQNHWERTGITHPNFIPSDPRVVFPMESGGLQIALKSDLYPIFDPRTLNFKVDQAVLNSDATRLYLLDKTGQLHCMKLPTLGRSFPTR